MYKISIALFLSIFVSTLSYGQMSGAQSKFNSDMPVEAPTDSKMKGYSRGGHGGSTSGPSSLDILSALESAKDTSKSVYNGGEVIVRKAQKANANDTTYRVALLIGNGDYQNDKVSTALNDVTCLSTSLQNAGFEVIELRNVSQRIMMREITDFIAKSKRARYSVFYFAGHAVNFNGVNYLVPVGAEPTNATDLQSRTYNLTALINSIKKTHTDSRNDREILVMIDASRTNNFYAAMKIKHQKTVATIGAPHGVMVLQASVNGFNAITGENTSLFAKTFATEFMKSQTVGAACTNTSKEVFKQSNKMQLPMLTGHEQHIKLIN